MSGPPLEIERVQHDPRRLSSPPRRISPEASTRRPIRVLPHGVAARIAAGEVIERPTSVVKELIENALDAGARNIRVDIEGGGLRLIRVGDDGEGIPAEQLPLALERHATSKLPDDDLAGVATLGFRGEALPSIAAVAELTILSAPDGSGAGRRLTVREGRVTADEPAARPRGTTVVVRHLFQNVPARLAVAARPQTEVPQIAQLVRRLGIAAPAVRFSLFVDGRPSLDTSGRGDLASALADVYGPSLHGSLLALGAVEVAGARISGFVSGPELTRPGRGQINVIVNGRWVQPRGLLTLLEAAYRPVLPRGRHPVMALVIDTAPDCVDINIHPAKLEVRLVAERAIGEAAGELLRATLGRRPLPLRQALVGGPAALAALPGVAESTVPYDEDAPIETPGLPPMRLLGQVHGRLVLLEGAAGLYLIDQHRAHERILYERLASVHGAAEAETALLPEPLLIELRPGQVAPFGRRLEDLAAFGFRLEAFGGRTFLLREAPLLPGVLPGRVSDPVGELSHPDDLVDALLALTDEPSGDGETWRDRLLVRLACRTAVRRGRPLDRPVMRALVELLGYTSMPAVCPHGSPLLMHVDAATLARQFGWR